MLSASKALKLCLSLEARWTTMCTYYNLLFTFKLSVSVNEREAQFHIHCTHCHCWLRLAWIYGGRASPAPGVIYSAEGISKSQPAAPIGVKPVFLNTTWITLWKPGVTLQWPSCDSNWLMKCKEARSTDLQLCRVKGLKLKTRATVTSKTATYAKRPSIWHKCYFCAANVDVAACYHGKAALPGTDVLSW